MTGVGGLLALLVSYLFYDQVAGVIERLFMGLAHSRMPLLRCRRAFYSYEFWQALCWGCCWLRGLLLAAVVASGLELPHLVIVVDLFRPVAVFDASVDLDF
ncbi:MAG: hypothetical protein R3C44_07100 [Chloroflexota bacterium]